MGTTIARTSITMIILDIIRFVLELCMLNSIFFTSDGLECAMGKGMLASHRGSLEARFASRELKARFASHEFVGYSAVRARKCFAFPRSRLSPYINKKS